MPKHSRKRHQGSKHGGGRENKYAKFYQHTADLINAGEGKAAMDYYLAHALHDIQDHSKLGKIRNFRNKYIGDTPMTKQFIDAVSKEFPAGTLIGNMIRKSDTRASRLYFWHAQFRNYQKKKLSSKFDRELGKIIQRGILPFPKIIDFHTPEAVTEGSVEIVESQRGSVKRQARFNLTHAQKLYDVIVKEAKTGDGFTQAFSVLALCGRRSADLVTAKFEHVDNDPEWKDTACRISNYVKNPSHLPPYIFPLLLNWDDWSQALKKTRDFLRSRGVQIDDEAEASEAIKFNQPGNKAIREWFESNAILEASTDGDPSWVSWHSARKLYVAMAIGVTGTKKKNVVYFIDHILAHSKDGSTENYAPRFDTVNIKAR